MSQIETIWGPSEGKVYFIAAGGWIKIGFTKGHPAKRLRQLQTGNPAPLTLLGAIDAPACAETEIHEVLDSFRGVGEWFRADEYPLAVIEDLLREVQ